MSRFARLLILLVLLALGLASRALPGRAQTAPVSSRFAFSDTTLLRDTLDLSFGQLFPLADSLRMTPDSLRALSIRYLMPIERLVFLSDSLRMPVDSVGSVMRRAEFDPLASRVQQLSAFAYGSSYNVSRQTNTWTNRADYNFVHGPLFLHNATNISIRRTSVGSRENLYQVRSADTEAGWRFSPNFSAGGRIGIQGTQNVEATTRNTSRSQYQVSVHTRQQPSPSLSSEIDFFGGPFDEPSASKRGMSGELDAHSAFMHRDWLTHDITGRVNSRFGHATFVDGSKTGTQDVTGEGDRRARDVRRPQGRPPGQLRRALRPLLAAAHDRRGPGLDHPAGQPRPPRPQLLGQPRRHLPLPAEQRPLPERHPELRAVARVCCRSPATASEVLEPSPAHSLSLSSDGRYTFRGWALDGRFTNGYPVSEGPKSSLVSVVHQGVTDTIVQIPVDYRERASSHNRSLDLRAQQGARAEARAQAHPPHRADLVPLSHRRHQLRSALRPRLGPRRAPTGAERVLPQELSRRGLVHPVREPEHRAELRDQRRPEHQPARDEQREQHRRAHLSFGVALVLPAAPGPHREPAQRFEREATSASRSGAARTRSVSPTRPRPRSTPCSRRAS